MIESTLRFFRNERFCARLIEVSRQPNSFRHHSDFHGVAGGLVIAELGLRVIGYYVPRFYVPDNEVGWAPNPGAAGWYTDEGRSYFKVNSHGRHDADIAVTKPPHTIRIAILGDSFTEAKQVPIEQNFWSVIGRELPKCPAIQGKRVE